MRHFAILILALFLAACAAATSPVPETEEGQVREAELLIRHSLTDRIIEGTRVYYRDQLGSFLVDKGVPANEAIAIVDEAFTALAATEHDRLIESLVPIYRRFYTPAEIHQLLAFYQTDVARKSVEVSPQIAAEGRQYIRLWNEHFGEELMERIAERVEAGEFPVTEGK